MDENKDALLEEVELLRRYEQIVENANSIILVMDKRARLPFLTSMRKGFLVTMKKK